MKPYYEQDGITIYHGDCREVFPPVDVIVTDPPYGTGQKIAYDVYRDYMPQWRELMAWLLALNLPTVFTMSHTRLPDLPKWPNWLGCWDKIRTGGIMSIACQPTWEPICFYNLPFGATGRVRWCDMFRFLPPGMDFGRPYDADEHPCPKPVDLYRSLIVVMPNGLIGDPMMGSGTTLVAAKSMGLSAIGCDISERYCEIAAKRLSQGVLRFDIPILEMRQMALELL